MTTETEPINGLYEIPKGTTLTPQSIGGLPLFKAGDKTTEEYLNLMLYGYPGSGKTRLAGSADLHPEMRPVLYIDYEAGIKPIRKLYPEVTVISVTSWTQMQDVYADLFYDLHGFKTVVVDTLSELQQLSMGEIMQGVVMKAEEDGKFRVEEVPDKREYMINGGQMRKMVRAFRNLPCNFICCIHAQDDKDSKGRIHKKPNMSGKFAHEVAGMFDVVLYTYVTEGEEGQPLYVALSGQTSTILAKDRSDNLPQIVGTTETEPLNMKYIYDTYIYGDSA